MAIIHSAASNFFAALTDQAAMIARWEGHPLQPVKRQDFIEYVRSLEQFGKIGCMEKVRLMRLLDGRAMTGRPPSGNQDCDWRPSHATGRRRHGR